MSDTYYWVPSEKKDRRAVLLRDGKSDPELTSVYPAIAEERRSYVGGTSGLQSTAVDYWRFCQMLLNGGEFNGTRLLSPKTIEWMATNHIGEIESFVAPGARFGLGVAVVTDRAMSPTPATNGTYFWGGRLGTFFFIDPEEELIGIFMSQVHPAPLRYRLQFVTLVYSAIVE